MTRFRTAVLGLNHYHVTGWLESLNALSDTFEIVCVYDPDVSRFKSSGPEFSDPSLPASFPDWLRAFPFETDLDRLIAIHAPDIALVTLPNALAPAAIIRLASAGIHILSDKPAGINARQVALACAAAQESGATFAAALTRRYVRGWRDARSLIQSGALGRLLSTESVFVTSSVAVRGATNPIFDREQMGGGVVHWLGVHDIDALMWMTGEPIVNVLARTGTVGDERIAVEDVASASIVYVSGAIGTMHMAYALPQPGTDGYIAIRGTEGSLRITPDGSWTLVSTTSPTHPLSAHTSRYEFGPSTGYGHIGTVILHDLVQAIGENREPQARGQDAANALSVVDAMYASASQGQSVDVAYQT